MARKNSPKLLFLMQKFKHNKNQFLTENQNY